MTDEELMRVLEDMERIFGELPSPVHEPIRFAYYVRMYRHYYERKN